MIIQQQNNTRGKMQGFSFASKQWIADWWLGRIEIYILFGEWWNTKCFKNRLNETQYNVAIYFLIKNIYIITNALYLCKATKRTKFLFLGTLFFCWIQIVGNQNGNAWFECFCMMYNSGYHVTVLHHNCLSQSSL